ncbi:MAG TPA: hypothetical protein VLY23_17440 [Candidatus Acidoferrum sp.]|nr:hypothetical protein [Candidatus Acidoferrum sp.]
MKLFHLIAAGGSMILLGFAVTLPAQEAGPMPPRSQAAAAHPQQPAVAPPQAAATASSAPTSTPANSGTRIELPIGTHIPLVLHNAISTRSARPGDPVYFETSFPVMLNGKIVVPAGSWVSGEVTESKRPGRVKGRAELMVRLNTLILPNAYVVSLAASPGNAGTGGNETTDKEGKVIGDTDKGSDVGTIAKTTAAGAGIGGLATQTGKGVGIGAGVGAAVGLATVLFTRGPEAELPRGTTLDAILDHPVLLDVDKVQFSSPGQASALPGPPNREPQRTKNPF